MSQVTAKMNLLSGGTVAVGDGVGEAVAEGDAVGDGVGVAVASPASISTPKTADSTTPAKTNTSFFMALPQPAVDSD
jgi:hypothetical protein